MYHILLFSHPSQHKSSSTNVAVTNTQLDIGTHFSLSRVNMNLKRLVCENQVYKRLIIGW